MEAAAIVRSARASAGLTQAELARRLGVKQPSVARMEAAGNGVTVATLQRVAAALGGVVALSFEPGQPSVDDTLIESNLKLTPADRLKRFEAFHSDAVAIREAGETARARR